MLALQTAHAARSDKHMCTCRLHYLLQSCALVRRWRTCKSESAEARAKPHCAIKHTSQNHPIKNCSRQHMVCTYCSAFGVPRIAGRCNADADAFSQVLSSARTWHSVQWSVEMPGRRRRRRQRLGRLAASLSTSAVMHSSGLQWAKSRETSAVAASSTAGSWVKALLERSSDVRPAFRERAWCGRAGTGVWGRAFRAHGANNRPTASTKLIQP